MSTLLYQCPAGLSGDMNLGAMVALGLEPAAIEAELRKLPYKGWSLHFENDIRQGITGTRCDVILQQSPEQAHSNVMTHTQSHGHSHAHHEHRGFREIREAIEGSKLSNRVKADSIACFRALAEAEGAVHGIDPDEVHFHEVGAIDSIIDMVGAAICWDLLDVDRVVCSTLEVGGGTVKCAHGIMPVPAPATARLLQGKPFTSGATNKETTTPTGASLLVGKGAEFGGKTCGPQIKTGIGIGQRDDPNFANAVYVSLIDESIASKAYEQDEVVELATNIDDMSAEAISYLCEQVLTAGALDVWQTPATFKKGRLGCVVHALAPSNLVAAIEATFFKYSRTLGVRRKTWQRSKLTRETRVLDTPWGPVRVKQASDHNALTRHKFEYDDCARIAAAENQSLDWVEAELTKLL
ncbi:MAG: nickel pincer cofactor biosynthesis protein LarC [Opitutales bacterium]|nr:nickel pincer cofactor biosynthesis protein LarC [Opitutales bacterium]